MEELKGKMPNWVLNVEKVFEDKKKCRHHCNCGHSMIIPEFVPFQVCDHCGNKVYTKKGFKMMLTKAS